MHTRNVLTTLAIGSVVVPFTVAMSASDMTKSDQRCTPAWEMASTPPLSGSNVAAETVSAISGREVRFAGTADGIATWSMRWTGRSVTETPPPSVGPLRLSASVLGSSYASADEGWLLLDVPIEWNFGLMAGGLASAAHWRDGRWTVTPTAVSPDPAGTPVLRLADVASLGPGDAWAVGRRETVSGQATRALIERWDGRSWSVAPHPDAGAGSTLAAVDAAAPDDVWAVGTRSPEAGNWTDSVPLARHYDGSGWTDVPTPEIPPELRPARLAAVSATGDGRAWAVGVTKDDQDGGGQALVWHYDGTTWRELPDPGLGSVHLDGVYASSADDVWIIANRKQATAPDLLHWDGAVWTTAEWPAPKQYLLDYRAYDIDGTGPHDVWAVGDVTEFAIQSTGTGSQAVVPVTSSPQIAHLTCRER